MMLLFRIARPVVMLSFPLLTTSEGFEIDDGEQFLKKNTLYLMFKDDCL